MKKKYEKPSVEILSFELENSLLTSFMDDEDPSMGGSGYDAPPF